MPGEQGADFGAIKEELEYRHWIRLATHGAEKAEKNKDMPGKSLIEGTERHKRDQPLQRIMTDLKIRYDLLDPKSHYRKGMRKFRLETGSFHRRQSSAITRTGLIPISEDQ